MMRQRSLVLAAGNDVRDRSKNGPSHSGSRWAIPISWSKSTPIRSRRSGASRPTRGRTAWPHRRRLEDLHRQRSHRQLPGDRRAHGHDQRADCVGQGSQPDDADQGRPFRLRADARRELGRDRRARSVAAGEEDPDERGAARRLHAARMGRACTSARSTATRLPCSIRPRSRCCTRFRPATACARSSRAENGKIIYTALSNLIGFVMVDPDSRSVTRRVELAQLPDGVPEAVSQHLHARAPAGEERHRAVGHRLRQRSRPHRQHAATSRRSRRSASASSRTGSRCAPTARCCSSACGTRTRWPRSTSPRARCWPTSSSRAALGRSGFSSRRKSRVSAYAKNSCATADSRPR